MSKRKEVAEEAVTKFLNGYNCAQSVLLTIASHDRVRSTLIPKIATGFGSGIGRCGSVCGALTGGVMALGMKYGTNKPSQEERAKCYELTRELYTKFAKRHGTVLCKELIGYDLSRAKELDKAKSDKVFEKKCPDFVRTVVEIIMDFDVKNKPRY
jgi:C_GCAxxG_C_C family probable redox protein